MCVGCVVFGTLKKGKLDGKLAGSIFFCQFFFFRLRQLALNTKQKDGGCGGGGRFTNEFGTSPSRSFCDILSIICILIVRSI